jgi:membrane glycosyltransferase
MNKREIIEMPSTRQSASGAVGRKMSSPQLTPAGLQCVLELAGRRRFVAALNLAVYLALLLWLGAILSHGGWSAVDIAILIAFAVAAPWSVLGVCNAALGFWLLHFRKDGFAQVAPFAAAGKSDAPLSGRIAVLMTIRNEDAARAISRLRDIHASVAHTGQGAVFDWFVLSDTGDLSIAAHEEAAFGAWRAAAGDDADRLHYRRRTENAGFKAGNIREFCERCGAQFEWMIPLDADSLMDGETILRMARICDTYPRLGILQSLVVGAPSRAAFARIFQFGMRHGMRTYTMGASWWSGDCGPYWGHNAIVRIAPFRDHCALPKLKNGRDILSHDQIEAALMRRAGFEVRVLPLECGSFEENPPTLLDFVKRDLRWCRGNMQYLGLLRVPDLLPMSRFQLFWAVSMFVGAPAWTAIVLLAPFAALDAREGFPVASLQAFYLLFLAFHLAPKLAGFADVFMTRGAIRRYGGSSRFLVSATVELISSFVIGAVTSLNVTLFLAGLPFGRRLEWTDQARDAHGLSWGDAARALWPHAVLGAWLLAVGMIAAPALLLWSLPLTIGYWIAIPFAWATALPGLGAWFARVGLVSTPEERAE